MEKYERTTERSVLGNKIYSFPFKAISMHRRHYILRRGGGGEGGGGMGEEGGGKLSLRNVVQAWVVLVIFCWKRV